MVQGTPLYSSTGVQTVYRLSRNVPTVLNILDIAEHGSINKASEALNISQPALTRSISRLEALLGVSLFDRTAQGVTPTVYGDALLYHARALKAELENTLRDISALKNNKSGTVRIGATPLVASHFLSKGLQAIFIEHDSVPVRLVEGNRPQLLLQLRRGELDVVVSTFPFEGSESDLVERPLFDLDLRIIARADHPLADRNPLVLKDMANSKWILPRADSGLSKRVQRDFSRADVELPKSMIETSSLDASRSLVQTTDLLAILPLRAVETEIKQGQLIALSGDWSFERRTVGLFLREDRETHPVIETLAKAIAARPI